MIIAPRFTRLAAIAIVGAGLALASGCKSKTPQERLEKASEMISEQNKIPFAVLELKELIKDAPQDPAAIDARFLLAEIYMSLGRQDQMQSALTELAAVTEAVGFGDERGVQAHQMATQIYARLGDAAAAIKHAREGVEKVNDPKQKLEMEFLLSSVILAQPDQALHPEAEEFFKRSSLEVEDPYMRGQARELIAQHYRLQDRFAESSAVYESYIAKFPDDEINGQLYIAQALNAQLAKDEPKFQELFAKGEAMLLALIAAELEPEAKIRKQNELATLYQAGGFIDKGIAVLREVMAANVGKAPAIQAQFAIGAMLARANRLEEAKAHFAQMQRENPGSQIAIDAEQMARMVTEREAAIAAAANDAATSPTATIPPSGSN